MEKRIVSSCDTHQQARWFARYLQACQYDAVERGTAIYASDMDETQVSAHWADFVTNWQPRLRNKADELQRLYQLQQEAGYNLSKAQGAFMETPSACQYDAQERLSLNYQEAYNAHSAVLVEHALLLSFADLAEETKARLARNEEQARQYQSLQKMAGKVWARERAEREAEREADNTDAARLLGPAFTTTGNR
jgi:hypothetical protein